MDAEAAVPGELGLWILAAYAVTFVTADASLFEGARQWLVARSPRFQVSVDHKHFLRCRMCLGFWASVIVCLLFSPHDPIQFCLNTLAVYGGSYFLATLER